MREVLASDPAGAWCAEVPRSIARIVAIGLALMILAFGGFGAWAFTAPLAAAVVAQGAFVATGQNKIVQHLEGGIIERLLVAEGERVEAGEALVRLDGTAARASERELFLRRMRLETRAARLAAEHEGRARFAPPAAVLAAQDDPEIAAIVEGQRLAFKVSRTTLDQEVALLQRNSDALGVRARGYRALLVSHRGQRAIFAEELAAKSRLYERGLTRRTEVKALERGLAEAQGQIGRLEAEIEEIEQLRLKYEAEIEQAVGARAEAALEELQAVEAELAGIRERERAARDVLVRAEVRAPVDGTVVRMHFNTPGGVVESGEPILEILPAGVPLIVEAQIPRIDIDSVRLGQGASVRLVALNQRTTPVLEGEVIYISADAVAEASQGRAREVYVVRVGLGVDELARVGDFAPTPGMPAELLIRTEERTFAEYLARPVLDSMSRAFREP